MTLPGLSRSYRYIAQLCVYARRWLTNQLAVCAAAWTCYAVAVVKRFFIIYFQTSSIGLLLGWFKSCWYRTTDRNYRLSLQIKWAFPTTAPTCTTFNFIILFGSFYSTFSCVYIQHLPSRSNEINILFFKNRLRNFRLIFFIDSLYCLWSLLVARVRTSRLAQRIDATSHYFSDVTARAWHLIGLDATANQGCEDVRTFAFNRRACTSDSLNAAAATVIIVLATTHVFRKILSPFRHPDK